MPRKPRSRYNGRMDRRPRLVLLLAALYLAWPVRGLAQSVPALIRAGRWDAAESAAARYADPVARKLVLYERMLTPGAATAGEIAAFLDASPRWPRAALLHWLDIAIAGDARDATLLPLCVERTPTLVAARMRCASVLQAAGHEAATQALIRQTWIRSAMNPGQEAEFLARWRSLLRPEDQWARFERLAWHDSGKPGSPATRQMTHLAAAQRPAAEARLALLRGSRTAPALLAKLPQAARDDPGMVLALLRWMRLGGQAIAAATLWNGQGSVAEHAAAPARRAAFWAEREALARELLHADDAPRAYGVVAGAMPNLDSEFLAGWIALRRLGQPAAAARHFATLATLSPAAITQGRALYWLGRARAAAGGAAAAQAAYRQAGFWLTTFYGQLGARLTAGSDAAFGARLRAARDPSWTTAQAAGFLGQEVARAALLLTSWGETWRARAFLGALSTAAPGAADRALAAHLALGLGLPDTAVAIARVAGLHGIMLPHAGWPVPYRPPAGPLDPAVALGVMRQESSFDPHAISPAGARGLMQLMPGTALAVAHGLGLAAPGPLGDPAVNMQLGSTYLAGLVQRFDGSLPVALAAYNAGPARAASWLAGQNPSGLAMLDWIELIPFAETRNYVQRCIEGITLYKARLAQPFTDPMAPWLG